DRVGGVARGVRDLQSDVPDAKLVAVAEPLMIEGEASGPVSEDRRVRRGGEVAVARDVVGVGVRLDDVRDLQALAPRQSQIFVDAVAARIDDDGLAGLAAADQVREAPGLLVQDLLEDHPGPRSEEHTSELQSRVDLVCRLLLEKKTKQKRRHKQSAPGI